MRAALAKPIQAPAATGVQIRDVRFHTAHQAHGPDVAMMAITFVYTDDKGNPIRSERFHGPCMGGPLKALADHVKAASLDILATALGTGLTRVPLAKPPPPGLGTPKEPSKLPPKP